MTNKRFTFLALVALFTLGFIASCDKLDEEDTPQTTQEDGTKLRGWTLGSNPYASYIPSDGDSLTIVMLSKTSCVLVYSSPTWGIATLTDVNVVKNDTAYLFSKPITSTLRADRSAWDFSAPVDSILMPNRNPQSGATTVKSYPIVLTKGYLSLTTPKHWQFDFDAYLVPRSEHIQKMSFRSGRVPAMP